MTKTNVNLQLTHEGRIEDQTDPGFSYTEPLEMQVVMLPLYFLKWKEWYLWWKNNTEGVAEAILLALSPVSH